LIFHDFFINFFHNQFIQFVLTGGGFIGFIKVILLLNGWRIYSFYRVYKHRDRFLSHPVFKKIDYLLKSNIETAQLKNLARKELANDILRVELFRIKQILKNNLKFILKQSSRDYLYSYKDFTSKYISELFIKEFMDYKSMQHSFARNKLTKNDYMSQDDFNRFWHVYLEYSMTYEIIVYESLSIYHDKKNLYGVLWAILDHFEILVEIISKTTAHKVNIMNGRVVGIQYKGYKID
jgi:hypothetical protein